MKKVLLIGRDNDTTNGIESILQQCFNVTTDFGDANLIDGMIRISIPDLVFINLGGIITEGREICNMLSRSYSKIPVILFGNQTLCLSYSSFLRTDQFNQLNCAILDNTLIRACCRIMNISYAETISAAKASQFGVENKKTILLVDDSALQNRISKNILEPTYAVRVSMSATQAIEVINEKKPDLIVLDYDMPEVDGYKFLRVLRENNSTADIPVIFLTGIVDKEHISKVIPLKPDGYLLKPVSAEKLLGRIKELLDRG